MKRNIIKKIGFPTFVLNLIILGFLVANSQQTKVLQIYKNNKVIKEYNIEDIDYIEINDIDIESEVTFMEVKENMTTSLDSIYRAITSSLINGWESSLVPGYDSAYTTLQRTLFSLEEFPSDEVIWVWRDYGVYDLNFGVASPDNWVIAGAYYTFLKIASMCNEFINRDFKIQNIPSATARREAYEIQEKYIMETKILRSAMYFNLINEFGNVPYYDENTLSDGFVPQFSSDFKEGRKLLTQQVINDLESIVYWYKDNNLDFTPEYGHVGLDVAEALLVRFYLNHEVFTGQPEWLKCLHYAQEIIQRRSGEGFNNSGLANNYTQCFSYSNFDAGANEIIWRTATHDSNGLGILSYANGTFMLNAFLGHTKYVDSNDQVPIYVCNPFEYNCGGYWQCMTNRKQLTEIFEWSEGYVSSPDARVKWWKTAADGFHLISDEIDGNDWYKCGFLPIKFTNWWINDDGSINQTKSPVISETPYIDFPLIRLSEIYLSAAEAILHGVGNTSDLLKYVNIIRMRAGMPEYTFANLNYQELMDERQRELYTECTRRTDLIRYGKWISGYTWAWKGGIKEGKDFEPNFIVYPLPAQEIEKGYVQNPGY